MKKIILSTLIITIITSVFLPKFAYAYSDTSKTTMDEATIDYDTFKEDSEKGSSEVGGNGEKGYTIEEGTTNSIIKNIVKIFNIVPTSARLIFTILTDNTSTDEIDKDYGKAFSIQKLVFNKIGIFSVNFFVDSTNDTDLQKNIKEAISSFYYMLRNFAIVATLVVLIYTGIRMAISSIAVEKAQYKQMIVNWFVGFAILMILPYIMIFVVTIGEILIEFCETIMVSLCGGKIKGIEDAILNSATTSTEKGFSLIIPTIIYWVMTFYQLKFFFMYGKRLFNVAFLIIISPLILVQHIFDKAGDNQASSFNVWVKEFVLNILIQPLHAALYMVFMAMASNIVQTAPIVAVIFIGSLSRGEKVLKNIMMIRGSNTVENLSDNVNYKKLKKLGK